MEENDDHEEFGEPELEQLAYKWLEDIRHNLGGKSGEAVVSMNFSAPPEVQWRFILIAVSLSESDVELSHVAAGPIEHLLGWHGKSYIGVVENEVAENPKLARALTGVWKYLMPDEVWSRVRTLQKGVSKPLLLG
jgi:uncharacterized protein DUF6869